MYEFDSLTNRLPAASTIDRARPLPGLVEGRLAEAAGARVRQPPRLVHQVGLRAEPHRGQQRLTGVAGVGDRPLAPCSAGRRCTPRASPGCGRIRRREISTPCRARIGDGLAVAHRAHPDDPAVLDDRSSSGASVHTGMLAVERGAQHLTDQRRAVGQQRLPAGLRAVGADHDACRDGEGSASCGCSATATAPRSSSPPDRGSGPGPAAASVEPRRRAPCRPTASARSPGRCRCRPWRFE